MKNEIYFPRGQLGQLELALADSPVVFIQGPRQCGKTTLAQIVGSNLKNNTNQNGANHQTLDSQIRNHSTVSAYQYYTMDDSETQTAATEDPAGFVKNLPYHVILDEVQRVPDLFIAIKGEVDKHREPGRFLLTGSTHAMSSPKISESLAGRMALIRLHPLSQKEIAQGMTTPGTLLNGTDSFLENLLNCSFETKRHPFDPMSLPSRIVSGGFPEPLSLPKHSRRNAWYRNYTDMISQRDILDLSRIRMLELIPEILIAAASQNAQLFNTQRIAQSLNVSWPAMRDYLTLLKKVYLLDILQPWHSNRMKRLVKTPKMHLGDTGLACSLLAANEETLKLDGNLYGRMLENFVYQELVRQASWRDDPIAFYHYRDKDQKEVDIVMEIGGRLVLGIEVKASATVRRKDFGGMRRLASASGDRFIAGAVLYSGDMCIAFDDNMFAVPIGCLWE